MKYTIEGFSQQLLIDKGLDCIDAVILRWYSDFQVSGKMTQIINKGKIYYWLKYDYVIQELPIIGIKNKESLYRRMKKLVYAGILEHYTKKSGGVFSCYRITENYYELTSSTKSTQKSEGIDSKVRTPTDSKVGSKDSSIKEDSSIKYITEKILSHWNNKENLQTHKVDTVKLYIKKRHNDILKSYSENEILRAIDNYSDILMDNDKYYFSHRWPIWDFIIRGLHNFLDSSTPKINYLNKYKKDNDGIENNFITQGTREKIFNKK